MRKNGNICDSILIILLFLPAAFFAQNLSDRSHQQIDFGKPYKICWEFTSNEIIGDKIASDNNRGNNIYISDFSGNLTSLNFQSGEVLWSSQLGGEAITSPIYIDQNIYLLKKIEAAEINSDDGLVFLLSVNASTGLTNWKKQYDSIIQIIPLYGTRNLILLIYKDGTLALMEPENGDINWSFDYEKENIKISAVTRSENSILISAEEDKQILSLSLENGEVLRKIQVERTPKQILSVDKSIIWADETGFIFAQDSGNAKVIWKRVGGSISSIVNTSEGVLVSSLDNFVYLLNGKNGGVIWKKRFSSRLLGKPVVNNGSAVLTPADGNVAEFIDLKTGKKVNNLTLSDATIISSAIFVGNSLILPTSKGIRFYSQLDCNKKAA